MKEWKLSVIAQTKEKFMGITAKIPVDKTSRWLIITKTEVVPKIKVS